MVEFMVRLYFSDRNSGVGLEDAHRVLAPRLHPSFCSSTIFVRPTSLGVENAQIVCFC